MQVESAGADKLYVDFRRVTHVDANRIKIETSSKWETVDKDGVIVINDHTIAEPEDREFREEQERNGNLVEGMAIIIEPEPYAVQQGEYDFEEGEGYGYAG